MGLGGGARGVTGCAPTITGLFFFFQFHGFTYWETVAKKYRIGLATRSHRVYRVKTPRPFLIHPLKLYGHASCKFPIIYGDLSKKPINYGKFTECTPISGIMQAGGGGGGRSLYFTPEPSALVPETPRICIGFCFC